MVNYQTNIKNERGQFCCLEITQKINVKIFTFICTTNSKIFRRIDKIKCIHKWII